MKKALPLIMAAAISLSILSGCTKSATETTATTEATTEAAVTTQAPATTEAETTTLAPVFDGTLRIGSLKGPTSIGLVSLMDKSSKGQAAGSYEFTMVVSADELVAKMVNNELDIALLPANVASILFNKTNHGINVIDINTLGVLYIVSANEGITSMADLKGKTIYLTGKGTTPDYVLNYLLSANGLTAEDVTLEYKSEPTEVAALLKESPDAIGLLPQPFVTVAMTQNESLKIALDLTKEWDKVAKPENGSLITGVTVARGDLFEEQAEAIKIFMAEHMASSEYANAHIEETAQLIADAGIIEKAPIAAKALPYCGITYLDGEMMKSMLSGYLQVLHDMDPKSIGGTLPGDDFYYIP